MSPTRPQRAFLTAEWRHLAMLNYPVEPALLAPRLPAGCELDSFAGVAYISLIGFLFLDIRVGGVPIPFHRDFAEMNLRFYVRRLEAGGVRRGVVFHKEIVPRRAIAAVARLAYNENYRALPMRRRVEFPRVEYGCRLGGTWNQLRLRTTGECTPLRAGSKEQFLAEHYWGYGTQRDGSTIEYRVEHPSWRMWKTAEASFDGNAEALYGREFAKALTGPPESAFLAEGSPVTVWAPRRL